MAQFLPADDAFEGTPTCPLCRTVIPAADINVAQDVAFCRKCNRAQSLSELVQPEEIIPVVDLTRPPPGVWYRWDGLSTVIGTSHRSWGLAGGMLAMALFWNGIVSIFVGVALSSTVHLLGFPSLPWLPNAAMGHDTMGWGVTLFLWAFLTPFIVVGLLIVAAFFSALGGRTEIQLRPGQGTIFHGFGPLGWTRHFDPQTVRGVRREEREGSQKNSAVTFALHNGQELTVAFISDPDRRAFIMAALRKSFPD
jgi:hypothetical protein